MKTETTAYIALNSLSELKPRYVAALNFHDQNLIPDHNFYEKANSEDSYWGDHAQATYGEFEGEVSRKITANSSIIDVQQTKYVPAVQNETFTVGLRVFVSSDFNGTFAFGAHTYDSSKVDLLNYPQVVWLHTHADIVKGEWVSLSGTLTVFHIDTAYFKFRTTVRNDATTGYILFDYVQVTRDSGRDDTDGDITYLTSKPDSLVHPDAFAIDRIDGCIVSISGQTQKISPDKAQHTIGSITIQILDVNQELSTKINAKLNGGESLRYKRVVLYKGNEELTDWTDYSKRLTYIVDGVTYKDAVYTLTCSDIQRATKTDIFEPHQGVLTATVTASQLTIPITVANAENKFVTVAHDELYSDHPSAIGETFGYLKLGDEIVCHSGWTDGTFSSVQVVTDGRGALNTVAAIHEVEPLSEIDQRKKVDEYIYLEMPAPKLAYALLTGILHGQSATLPAHWHLPIAEDLVTLSDFTGIGDDLWNLTGTTRETAGKLVRFAGLKAVAGKQFIEEQLLLWMGTFMPVYSDGSYGLKKLQSVLPYAPYLAYIDETQITAYSELMYDQKAVINNIAVKWNWIDNLERHTKVTQLIDSDSISKHGYAPLKTYEFSGVFTGIHSDSDISNYFDTIRNRYGHPPLRLNLDVLPQWDQLEVGDTVRLDCSSIFEYNINTTLSRVFEVQQVTTDWVTGKVSLNLFGGIEPATHKALSASFVMDDAYYTSTGTELSTVLTIVSGEVTVSNNPLSPLSGVYYYDGDLVIAGGVTVTIDSTTEFRIKGTLIINGTIDGEEGGHAGATGLNPDPDFKGIVGNYGTTGAAGTSGWTWGVEVLEFYSPVANVQASSDGWLALFGSFPVPVVSLTSLNILNPDGLSLSGIPADLRGSSGSAGNVAYQKDRFTKVITVLGDGGDGGASGAGLLIVARGVAFGLSGRIELSGADGTAGSSGSYSGSTFYGASGVGGSAGALLILIDGNASSPSSSHFGLTAGLAVDQSTTYHPPYVGYDSVANGESAAPHLIFSGGQDQTATNSLIRYIPAALNGYTWFSADEEKEVTGTTKPTDWNDLTDTTSTQPDDNANLITATSELTDDASLGLTADWSLVADDDGNLPADNADVTTDQLAGSGVNVANYKYSVFDSIQPTDMAGKAATATYTHDSGQFVFGSSSLKLSASGADAYLYLGPSSFDYNVNLEAGAKWLISAYVRCNLVSADVQLQLKTSDFIDVVANVTTGGTANMWTRISGVIDLTANSATTAILRIDNDGGTGCDMWFDGIMLEKQVGTLTTPSAYALPAGTSQEYTDLDGYPTNLTAINSTEGTKLTGIDDNADVTADNVVVSRTVSFFRVAATTPGTPTTGEGSYTFPAGPAVPPAGWSLTVPVGTGIVWQTTTTYKRIVDSGADDGTNTFITTFGAYENDSTIGATWGTDLIDYVAGVTAELTSHSIDDNADVTAVNTSADTALVNGIAAATVEGNADAANTAVVAMETDATFSIAEKVVWRQQWEGMLVNYTNILAQATTWSIEAESVFTTFTTAKTALFDYLNLTPHFVFVSPVTSLVNSAITGTDLSDKTKTYYDKMQLAVNRIADASVLEGHGVADNAQVNQADTGLLDKGIFTDDLLEGDWTTGTVVAISSVSGVDDLDGHTYALKLTTRDSYDETNRISVTVGETLYWGAWINTQATTREVNLGYRVWLNGVGQSSWPLTINLAAGQGWTWLTGRLTIAASTTSIAPLLQIAATDTYGEPLVQGLIISRNAIEATDDSATIVGDGQLAGGTRVEQSDASSTLRRVSLGLYTGSGRDTGSITFPVTWSELPVVKFSSGGLTYSSALSGDQFQNITATGLSTTGFTISARLQELAATPTLRTDTGAVAGTTPELVMSKSQTAEAFDDAYTFQYDVYLPRVDAGEGFWLPGHITVGIYTNDGGGWVLRATVSHTGNTSSDVTLLNLTKTVTVDGLGQHAGYEFGIHEESGNTGSNITSFDSVKYTTATAPTDTSATPSGAPDVNFFVIGGA